MRFRRKVSKKGSKRLFRKTVKPRKVNTSYPRRRGGISL